MPRTGAGCTSRCTPPRRCGRPLAERCCISRSTTRRGRTGGNGRRSFQTTATSCTCFWSGTSSSTGSPTSIPSPATRRRSRPTCRRCRPARTACTPTSCTRAASPRRWSRRQRSDLRRPPGTRPMPTTHGSWETGNVARLADGSTMTWERADTPIVVDQAAPLRFAVRTADGKPAALELYMGMAAHAMITRDDGTVFVHLHPEGTISVAAQETFVLRQPGDTIRGELRKRLAAMDMGRWDKGEVRPGAVSFPYAFPKPGRYRLWVQVKRNGRILTGVFDAEVSPAR